MPELVRARSVTGRQGRCPRQPPRWLPRDPKFIADTDFASLDPVRLDYGQSISPEGNAHQAEFTRDNKYFIATDEDFDPYRVTATMGDGTSFTAIQGSDVPQIDQDTTLAGDTRCVGLACDTASIPPADAAHPVAVIERGVCDFTVKVQNVEAQGYKGAIVFNRTGVDGCETLISMLVEASIPAVFVSRTTASASSRAACRSATRARRTTDRGRRRRRRAPTARQSTSRPSSTAGATSTSTTPRRCRTWTSTPCPRVRTRHAPAAWATCRCTRWRPTPIAASRTSPTTRAASGS